jgi:O-methyltransferase
MNRDKFIKIVKPFTMTSEERIIKLFESLEYIRTNNIEGDLVECGVWKGGNILGMMEYLYYHKMENCNIWLYDTFKGMTKPGENDIDFNNNKAMDVLNTNELYKCYSSLEEVRNNLNLSNLSIDKLVYVIGDVCETLDNNNNVPKKISLLRLDTDWYESTKKEMEILYPNLVNNGILIVDDYGHWKGSRKAIDEYIFEKELKLHIEKIDYTGIKITKLQC